MSVFWVDLLETEIRVCVVLLRRVAGHGCGRRAYALEAWRRMEAETVDQVPCVVGMKPETLFVLARRILASQPARTKYSSPEQQGRPTYLLRRCGGARLKPKVRSSEGHLTH